MTRGKIRFLARRFVEGDAIPLFADNCINRAINSNVRAIYRRRTYRRASAPDCDSTVKTLLDLTEGARDLGG